MDDHIGLVKKADVKTTAVQSIATAWTHTHFPPTEGAGEPCTSTELSQRLAHELENQLDEIHRLKDTTTDDGGTTFIKPEHVATSENEFQMISDDASCHLAVVKKYTTDVQQDGTNPRLNVVFTCPTCQKVMRPAADAMVSWKVDQHARLHTVLSSQLPTAIKCAAQRVFGLNTSGYMAAVEHGIHAAETGPLVAYRQYPFSKNEIDAICVAAFEKLGQCGGCDCVKVEVKRWSS